MTEVFRKGYMAMSRYKITQVYSTAKDVDLNKKLETPRNFGIYDAYNAVEAIKVASQVTSVPQICLHANRIKE